MFEFIKKHEGEVFRYVQYRRMWTPYEMEEKFRDESETETTYSYARIIDCVSLGNGDYLLELDEGEVDTEYDDNNNELPVFCSYNIKKYRRLSDIQIDKFDYDNKVRMAHKYD